MKICYVNPTFLIRRPIADLIDNLGSNNEVSIFVPKKPFKKIDQSWHSNKSLKKAKIYSYSAINIPFLNFEWPIPITPMFLVNILRAFRNNEVIHMWAYFYINSWATLIFNFFLRKKKLILSSDTFPGYSFNPGEPTKTLFKIYNTVFGKFLFSIPNKVHIYGESMKKFALEAGVRDNKIIILPTGINLEKFSNATPIDRESLGLKKEDFVIFYAGLMVPRKGIDIMLKTLKIIVKDNSNVKLLLVGDGPNKKDYMKFAKDLDILNKVIFKKSRTDIPNILRSVDLLFLPSKGEGLPGIVMEAMAAELPIVGSKIPGTSDLIIKGENGCLCEIEDVSDYADKINQLINNNRIREQFGKNSLEAIRSFSWEKLILNYRELYE